MTEDPASFAMIAAGNPRAPVPITTTSASKSHLPGVCPVAFAAPAATALKVNTLIPRDPATTTSRRLIEPLLFELFINALAVLVIGF